jgi:DNA-directed RNA polymerase subunit RPC12/RpoP
MAQLSKLYTCEHCGYQFLSHTRYRRYCCDECRQKGIKRKRELGYGKREKDNILIVDAKTGMRIKLLTGGPEWFHLKQKIIQAEMIYLRRIKLKGG